MCNIELARKNLTALVGYVGSTRRAYAIHGQRPPNIVVSHAQLRWLPMAVKRRQLWTSSTRNFGGGVRGMFYMSNSFYHALELGIPKKG